MKEIEIEENEAGQRFDKFLAKYMSQASKSFIYKMLRKKNITLNGRKATGSEKLQCHDLVKLFLSDDTIEKFSERIIQSGDCDLDIIYEDKHILLVNKPVGMLSQKAEKEDISLVEYLMGYLLRSQALTREELRSFRPSICNRLDRNTSGIVVAGKTLLGLQTMAGMFKERTMHKYYLCLVEGVIDKEERLKGYLHKDERSNKARVCKSAMPGALPIETHYHPIGNNGFSTLLKVQLITGRTHQIRSHLSDIGHPIIGDGKYGNVRLNEKYRQQYGLKNQLLHAYRIEMPEIEGELSHLSNRIFEAELPPDFKEILVSEQIEENRL